MKPVAVFRFSETEGPGYFATFLETREIPWQLFELDDGDVVPHDLTPFSGFVFMGGPMSANDVLPWVKPILALIREAVRNDQPCLGHCLGGQLMSRALGGAITRNPVKEIGWGQVQVENQPVAKAWFGDLDRFTTFQWHGETFSIPPGATRILSSVHCENQGYAMGRHLGLQCHVEMTPEMISAWCRDGAPEIATEISQDRAIAVQTPEQIQAAVVENLPALSATAEQLYQKWITGLSL